MISAQASHSAVLVARQRAAHQLLDDPLVLPDAFAVRILGADAEADLRTTGDDRSSELPLRAGIVARGRYADDLLAAALTRGTRQVVVLGAGLDTLAYRTRWPAGTLVVEADHPASQELKRRRLADVGIAVPAAVRFAALDLAAVSLTVALRESGLEPGRPTFFVCLGLVYYLEALTVRRLLSEVAGFAPGSEIVLDYFESLDDADDRPGFVALGEELGTHGEPWRSTFDADELAVRLAAAGFTDVDDLDSAAMAARYFAGRSDGLVPAGPMRFVHAARLQ